MYNPFFPYVILIGVGLIQLLGKFQVMIPLSKVGIINPVIMRENPSEKYIQIVTVDGHDFWYMGFVNYEKASKHLSESLSNFVASEIAVQPAPVA